MYIYFSYEVGHRNTAFNCSCPSLIRTVTASPPCCHRSRGELWMRGALLCLGVRLQSGSQPGVPSLPSSLSPDDDDSSSQKLFSTAPAVSVRRSAAQTLARADRELARCFQGATPSPSLPAAARCRRINRSWTVSPR